MGRYNDGHLALGERFEPFEKFRLAAHVEMGGWLVQEQHLRPADKNAGKTDGLFLPAGQAAAAFRNRHVITHRMAGDEAFDACKPRSSEHLLAGPTGVAERI